MSLYATVILPIPNENGFTYAIPEDLQQRVCPGTQVILPFKNRYVSGIVLHVSDSPPSNVALEDIKPIFDIVYETPIISKELMQLLEWISKYYICYLGEAYRLIHLNVNVNISQLKITKLSENLPEGLTPLQIRILENLPMGKEVGLQQLKKRIKEKSLPEALRQLEKIGAIQRRYEEIRAHRPQKMEDYFRLTREEERKAESQTCFSKIINGKPTRMKDLLQILSENEWFSYSYLKEKGITRQVINKAFEMGLVQKESRPKDRIFDLPYKETLQKVRLSKEQALFVKKVKEALQDVLIPEIVLTPQTLARFRNYYGDQVAILHSRLTSAERREILSRIREGKFKIVIGPRSAIFAPMQNLGIIIVDEEHESSYKQNDAQPHYHARDVAVYRASLNNAVVVLGSATPSFESLQNVRNGLYEYYQLSTRIDSRKLPRISIVDLKKEWKKFLDQPIISENLELKIESRLLVKEQVMLLQNLRGYSPYILCKDCGFVAKCKNCDITLTYHQFTRKLRCHYCDYTENPPDVCPRCQGMDLIYQGVGTQRLEEALKHCFPYANILRMDQDTTRGKHGHLKILEKFRSGEADILLGTQMIAKGLDFKKVSLVGIITADHGLHFPDFRASEKTFQLLTQAAGRAGRGASSGEVVVQTFDPSHYIYKFLLTHNYLGFFEREIESRKALNYPPFSRIILIRIEGQNLKDVQTYAEVISKFLWKANASRSFSILGPAPAPISKLKNLFRYQLLIKYPREKDSSMARLRHIIKEGIYFNPEIKKWPVKISIDVDPIDIL